MTTIRAAIVHKKAQQKAGFVGQAARDELREKNKKVEYTQRVLRNAKLTGVIEIGRSVNLSDDPVFLLKTIAKALRETSCGVLDIFGRDVLFELKYFKQLMDILDKTNVFAINMGEGKLCAEKSFGIEHFSLIAERVLSGASSLRRWFVEIEPTQRLNLEKLGLIHSKGKETVFTIARREDRRLWEKEGKKKSPRLAWLRATRKTYRSLAMSKIALQSSLTNFDNKRIETKLEKIGN